MVTGGHGWCLLPEIDLKVDSLAPYHFKCFLDAYKGYHQIQIAKEDEEETAFRTDMGTFCWKERVTERKRLLEILKA